MFHPMSCLSWGPTNGKPMGSYLVQWLWWFSSPVVTGKTWQVAITSWIQYSHAEVDHIKYLTTKCIKKWYSNVYNPTIKTFLQPPLLNPNVRVDILVFFRDFAHPSTTSPSAPGHPKAVPAFLPPSVTRWLNDQRNRKIRLSKHIWYKTKLKRKQPGKSWDISRYIVFACL